ncbi:hypothetical protein M231_03063 [Tremella mesenterica]|uniref:Something about silencing protein 4 domain-containing protein n=1 Tax=Tremella mesenterica TaxID=5217 RepID=A0A4Q1BP89_TREME|nr:hypothetical protein M231_03063 [Tremella mesenterica]
MSTSSRSKSMNTNTKPRKSIATRRTSQKHVVSIPKSPQKQRRHAGKSFETDDNESDEDDANPSNLGLLKPTRSARPSAQPEVDRDLQAGSSTGPGTRQGEVLIHQKDATFMLEHGDDHVGIVEGMVSEKRHVDEEVSGKGKGKGKSKITLAVNERPTRIRRAAGGGQEGIRDVEQMVIDWLTSYYEIPSTPPSETIIHLTTLPLSDLNPPTYVIDQSSSTPKTALQTPTRPRSFVPPSPRVPLPTREEEGKIHVPGWRVIAPGEDDREDAILEMQIDLKSPKKTRRAQMEEDDSDETFILRHRKHEVAEKSMWLREKETLAFERHKLRSRVDLLRNLSEMAWTTLVRTVLSRPEGWFDAREKVEGEGVEWLRVQVLRSAMKDLKRYDELLPPDSRKRKNDKNVSLSSTSLLPIDTSQHLEEITNVTSSHNASSTTRDRSETRFSSQPKRRRSSLSLQPLNQSEEIIMSKTRRGRPSQQRSHIESDDLTTPTTGSTDVTIRTLVTPQSAFLLNTAASSPLTPLPEYPSTDNEDLTPLAPSSGFLPKKRKRDFEVVSSRLNGSLNVNNVPSLPVDDPLLPLISEKLVPSLEQQEVDASKKLLDPPAIITRRISNRPRSIGQDHISAQKMAARAVVQVHMRLPTAVTRSEAREMREVEAAVVL